MKKFEKAVIKTWSWVERISDASDVELITGTVLFVASYVTFWFVYVRPR